MFEHHRQPLLSRDKFVARVARNAGIAFTLGAIALGVGVLGYRFIAGFDWVDALLNASMLLGGMGPMSDPPLNSNPAKVFASVYALFAGVVFLVSIAVLLAPVIHRLMHRFHLADDK